MKHDNRAASRPWANLASLVAAVRALPVRSPSDSDAGAPGRAPARVLTFAALLIVAAACRTAGPAPNPGGGGPGGGGTSGGGGTGEQVGAAGNSGGTKMDAGDSSGSTGGTRTDGAGGTGGSSAGTQMDAGGGPAFVCRTNSAAGGRCDCMDEKCADLIRICQRNAACTCLSSCLGQRRVGGIPSCLTDNGLAERPPGFAALEECVGVACPDSDECATPAGWRPTTPSTRRGSRSNRRITTNVWPASKFPLPSGEGGSREAAEG